MLSFPANGNITYDPATNVAIHSCDPGYAPSNTERTCQSNNQWSGTTITCQGKTMNNNHHPIMEMRLTQVSCTGSG